MDYTYVLTMVDMARNLKGRFPYPDLNFLWAELEKYLNKNPPRAGTETPIAEPAESAEKSKGTEEAALVQLMHQPRIHHLAQLFILVIAEVRKRSYVPPPCDNRS